MDGDTPSVPDSLPHALDTFVGRRDDVAEIGSLLTSARLLTLTGPGGVGKTRLALQVAIGSHSRFSGGARLVDFSGLTDPALLPHFVASQCGIAVRSGAGVGDAILARLRRQHLLLVLDNCEHVQPSLSWLVTVLLSGCPDLRILATSREPLFVPGEVTWSVAPLSLPVSGGSLEALQASDAVALLVARACVFLPDFSVDAVNAGAIDRIVRQVDGLPLALELAAGWLRVISLDDLASRLDDPLQMLSRGNRWAPERQQSLRATIAWSHDLLTVIERSVLARLAVFPGSFPLDAAIQVGRGAGVPESDLLPILARLVETSMVMVVDRIPEMRYRLLTPVRHFAREQLEETGSLDEAGERLLAWCLGLVSQGPPSDGSVDRSHDILEGEHDSLRAAMEWSLAHGDPASAGALAAGMWTFWLLRGHIHEGRHWLSAILERLDEPAPLRAHLLWVAGILARPDAATAMRYWSESRTIFRAIGDRAGEARILASIGYLDLLAGDYERSQAGLEESLTLLGTTSDPATGARVRTSLSVVLLAQGNPRAARREAGAARTTFRDIGDAFGEASAVANLGLVASQVGDIRTAVTLWEACLEMRRRIGDLGGTAHVLTLLGDLAVTQGDLSRGGSLLRESLAIRRQIGTEDGFPEVLAGLAAVAAREEPELATRLAGMALRLWELTGESGLPWDRRRHDAVVRNLRSVLAPDVFDQQWEVGVAAAGDPAFPAGDWPGLPGDTAPLLDPDDAPPGIRDVPPETLTPRETEVLRLLVLGLTYVQIGEALSISHRTVDAHTRAIYSKLDVHSRSAATRLALQRQIVEG